MTFTKLIEEIPRELKKIISLSYFEENKLGCSNTYIYKVKLSDNKENAYLKISKNSKESFEYEVNVLQWLLGKLPVPKILYYSKSLETEYFLMSEIIGLDSSNIELRDDPKKLVSNLAKGLRVIHDLDITDCPFNQSLEVKLKNAEYNVINDLVDIEDIKNGGADQTPQTILRTLKEKMPKNEDLVFTHGDYCLPNIIINDNVISGFIDWGRAGIADRYQDIGLACRSLKYNMDSEDLIGYFLKEYGIYKLDEEKTKYYILLDELF